MSKLYKMQDGQVIELTAEETKLREAEEKEWSDGAVERGINSIREKRNILLLESDWTQLADISDSRMDNLTKGKWQVYREELRDITNGLDTVDKINNVTWPTKPS
tara:strand:- start:620 stop:934 length:315 start_codon:yes stop_codon:yes gene_type:complete